MEKLLSSFRLPMVQKPNFVEIFLSTCFRSTGDEYSITFRSNRGTITYIEISCGYNQKEKTNSIYVDRHRTNKGIIKNKLVKVYHSIEKGVRVVVL